MSSGTKQIPFFFIVSPWNKTNFLDQLFFLTENGKFLMLDLGGTNLRVPCVHVNQEKKKLVVIKSERHVITEQIMKGTGEQVFIYIFSHYLSLKDI